MEKLSEFVLAHIFEWRKWVKLLTSNILGDVYFDDFTT